MSTEESSSSSLLGAAELRSNAPLQPPPLHRPVSTGAVSFSPPGLVQRQASVATKRMLSKRKTLDPGREDEIREASERRIPVKEYVPDLDTEVFRGAHWLKEMPPYDISKTASSTLPSRMQLLGNQELSLTAGANALPLGNAVTVRAVLWFCGLPRGLNCVFLTAGFPGRGVWLRRGFPVGTRPSTGCCACFALVVDQRRCRKTFLTPTS